MRSEAETTARPEIERLVRRPRWVRADLAQAKELRDGLALARRQAEALPNGDMTLAESDELIRKLEAMQRGRS